MATVTARTSMHRRGQSGKRLRWGRWLLMAIAGAIALTYGLGRTVSPVRQRLKTVPLVGALFADPKAGTGSGNGTLAAGGSTAGRDTVTEVALQALEARAAELSKLEAVVTKREEALLVRETALRDREVKLEQERKALDIRSSGLKSEFDQVEVVRNMKSTAALQAFAAMTDDQVVRLLRLMKPDEVGRLLSGLDGKRAANMIDCLKSSAPCVSKP